MRAGLARSVWVLLLAAALSRAAAAPWGARVTVREPLAEKRGPWPVLARVAVPAGDTGDALRVWATAADGAETLVPSQVLKAPDGQLDVCFIVDLDPGAVRTFRLGHSSMMPPKAAPALAYEGQDLGLRVDTGPAVFAFDRVSGQFAAYSPRLAGVTNDMTFFQQGRYKPCHWNPDVWVDRKPWGHTSDWDMARPDRAPAVRLDRGDLAFRLARRGPMWSAESVDTEVVYTVFAGFPFILEQSRMAFTNETRVRAIRHNELVFSRGLHTHVVWPGADGAPETVAIYNKAAPKTFLGPIRTFPVDTPWLGLFHDEGRYGIGIVNLSRRETAPAGRSTSAENARYYATDYGDHGTGERYDWNFAYICRALYWEGERTEPVAIPSGAVYEESSVFLVFGVEPEAPSRFRELQRWARLLRRPPEVTVQ